MKAEEVKNKLISFYTGETSVEEERELYVYFTTTDELAEELLDDQRVFLSLYDTSSFDASVSVPSGLEASLDAHIDELATVSKKRDKVSMWKWSVGTGIAASLAIGLFFQLSKPSSVEVDDEIFADTFNNPEDAYRATEETLLYTSVKINDAFSVLEKASRKTDKSKNLKKNN